MNFIIWGVVLAHVIWSSSFIALEILLTQSILLFGNIVLTLAIMKYTIPVHNLLKTMLSHHMPVICCFHILYSATLVLYVKILSQPALSPVALCTLTLYQKATIHQITTMLATSKYVLFPSPNHLLTTGTDDPSLAGAWVIIKVSGQQYWWLAGGYDLEIGHF